MRTLRTGDLLHRSFQTPQGEVEILAEIVVEDTAIHLDDVAIYPKGTDRLELGLHEVLAIRNALANELRQQGFDRLRISGMRYSGARPGKLVNLVIDL